MKKYFGKIASLALIALIPLFFSACDKKAADSGPTSQTKNKEEFPDATDGAVQPIKEEAEATEQSETAEPEKEEAAVPLPEKHLLEMPFYSQAPLSEWDSFHEDMCEEASILNAALYLEDKKISKEQFEVELQQMQDLEKREIREWKSTTVAETKKLVDAYFSAKSGSAPDGEDRIQTKIIENPTIEDIEAEIAAGNPVVVPLAGREIGNPNFTPPGPVYHMLVIKGYDSRNFITNDVGTRKGNSYVYKKEVIMKNIHDWNEKDIRLGGKLILILSLK